MPELPDVAAYVAALETRILGRTLERVRVASPSLLRTADPPLADFEGRTVTEIRRIGKTDRDRRRRRSLARDAFDDRGTPALAIAECVTCRAA